MEERDEVVASPVGCIPSGPAIHVVLIWSGGAPVAVESVEGVVCARLGNSPPQESVSSS